MAAREADGSLAVAFVGPTRRVDGVAGDPAGDSAEAGRRIRGTLRVGGRSGLVEQALEAVVDVVAAIGTGPVTAAWKALGYGVDAVRGVAGHARDSLQGHPADGERDVELLVVDAAGAEQRVPARLDLDPAAAGLIAVELRQAAGDPAPSSAE